MDKSDSSHIQHAVNLGADAAQNSTPDHTSASKIESPPAAQSPDPPALHGGTGFPPAIHRLRKWLYVAATVVGLAIGGYFLTPWIETTLNTVSTEDAYVNGHTTLVAPRVSGQVYRVLVDDNDRVKQGDLLVQLDKEPYEVQVALKRTAVRLAEAKLTAAESKVRSLEALALSQRWRVQTTSQQVKNQIAELNSRAAALQTAKATLLRAQADYERGQRLMSTRAMSREEFDRRQQDFDVGVATVNQALELVYQVRVSLGLPRQPENGKGLTDIPADLEETFSDVRAALSDLVQTMTQLGLPLPSQDLTPRHALAEFQQRDAEGNIDRILKNLLPSTPEVLQAKAQLDQARHDLEQAELNLRYCDIVSEIDGVVTGRNINPGNNAQAGQSLMAVRSLTEIWIDANFKETQLADLRIGQRVRCEVDMYGSHHEFEGRITGFTMGTGQTLSLLPAQNATGNFVKIVQRLPIRVELTDYNPEETPLFAGLSVTPYVYFKEPATGPHAGRVLRPFVADSTQYADSKR